MSIMDMVNQGNVAGLAIMGVIIVGILAMIWFFSNELKKAHGEKKNDQSVGSVGSVFSGTQQSGNSAVTAAISAAVNEYRKN
ncbi:hypothetical protein R84B8_00339 [Treponema sp. R8-4-B8]